MTPQEASQVVVVYERVSSDRQDIKRQEVQRERARAEYPDAENVVIQDDGVSAFKVPVFDRPGGRKLCSLIESGRVAAIYTDAQDRLSRGDDVEWVTFRALCESNGTRLMIDGRELRTDLGGRLEGYLKAILARQESQEKAHRSRGGARVRAERGHCPGGEAPYGFGRTAKADGGDLVLDPKKAPITRAVMRDLASGVPQQVVAQELNRDGVPTLKGKEWHQSTIRRLATNPVLIGKHRRRDGTVYDCTHPALVDMETWDAVQARIGSKDEPNEQGGRTARPRLFVKPFTLFCGVCGLPMNPRDGMYVCQSDRLYGAASECPMAKPVPGGLIDLAAISAALGHTDLDALREDVKNTITLDLRRVTAERALVEQEAMKAQKLAADVIERVGSRRRRASFPRVRRTATREVHQRQRGAGREGGAARAA